MSGSTSPVGAARVLVDVDDRQQAHKVNTPHLTRLLAATLDSQRRNVAGEVGLAFVGVDEMTSLNTEYMGGSGPTDVLAFPIDGIDTDLSMPAGQPLMFGDIIICPAVAARAETDLADELALLVVHGALHLVGHDHAEPEETRIMKALEHNLLTQFHTS